MAASQDPVFSLNYAWNNSSDNWAPGMDANMLKIGALIQLSVLDRGLAAPPGSPATGDRYLIAASPTGAWTGHAAEITVYNGSGWTFYVPQVGWLCYVQDEQVLTVYKAGGWSAGIAI